MWRPHWCPPMWTTLPALLEATPHSECRQHPLLHPRLVRCRMMWYSWPCPYRLRRRRVIWTCIRTCCAIGLGSSGPIRRRPFLARARVKPEQAEIERLRREVAKLKAERDILKKAAAYFAKDQT